jgi:hypothetical protein
MMLSAEEKEEMITRFKESTGTDALSTFYCASCSGETYCSERCLQSIEEIDINLLRSPDRHCVQERVVDGGWAFSCAVEKMMGVKPRCLKPQDDDVITQLAQIHRLQLGELDKSECRRVLAFHLMNGKCILMVAVNG